jgi:hypothetical protein
MNATLYTPLQVITKENNKTGICWNIDDAKTQAQ